MPTLSDQEDRRRGTRGRSRVRQPGVQRHHGRLDRQGDEEREEHPPLGLDRATDLADEVLHEEALLAARPREVQRDDPDEHDEPAGEAEQDELHGCATATVAPEHPDEEVDRDEHGFEDDVEEENVERGKDPDHEWQQGEHEREVRLGAAGVVAGALTQVIPRREQADRREHAGHDDEREGDPVDAHGI